MSWDWYQLEDAPEDVVNDLMEKFAAQGTWLREKERERERGSK
jgi:hypothetical protein